jgi:hypothetical protein
VYARIVLAATVLLNVAVTRPGLERALALARWPHSDGERISFHDRYLTAFNASSETLPAVVQIDVTTEFRRVELIAEEHARAGDSTFGRAGLDEVEAALKPWHGTVAIDAHLQLPGGCGPLPADSTCGPVIPPTDISVDGVGVIHARPALRPFWYARSGSSPIRLGNVAEATFSAASVGQATHTVRGIVGGHELARAVIDFGALE